MRISEGRIVLDEDGMVTPDLHRTEPRLLAQLLNVRDSETPSWLPGELGAILCHQLSAPVAFDLSRLDSEVAGRLQRAMKARVPPIRSFADLFRDRRPPLLMLELTKQFAKASRNHPDSPLPEEVASILYYGSIAAARLRLGRRITGLEDHDLSRALRWCLEQAWVNAAMQTLFRQGLEVLGAADEERA